MAASSQKLIKVCGSGSRACCVLLALSWNTNENEAKGQKTNGNPSTDTLSRAINHGSGKGCHETKLNPKKTTTINQESVYDNFSQGSNRIQKQEGHVYQKLTTSYTKIENF